jgi:dTDP-4-amino-4,6-dideoxygalactose transaminase
MKNRTIELSKPTLVDWAQVAPLFAQVWRSGQLTVGPFTLEFEQAAAQLMQVRNVVAVSSCTSGLLLVVRALNLTGEVVLPSFTWASTGHALIWNGLTPVFADVADGVYTLDPADVARRLTPRTSAIMAANAFGLYPDLDALDDLAKQHGVPLICDSAQAIGATYKDRIGGGLCRAEIFSLSPTKVVTAVEGGLIATDDDELARQVRGMRDYGKTADGADIESIGLSARLSEFHSIIGLTNLRALDELLAARRRLVDRYRANLAGLPGVAFQTIPPGSRSSNSYFLIFLDEQGHDRDAVWRRMAELKTQTKRYFYPPLHRLRSYAALPPPAPPLPVTERASRTALALPLYSHLSLDEVDLVCERLRSVLQ